MFKVNIIVIKKKLNITVHITHPTPIF